MSFEHMVDTYYIYIYILLVFLYVIIFSSNQTLVLESSVFLLMIIDSNLILFLKVFILYFHNEINAFLQSKIG